MLKTLLFILLISCFSPISLADTEEIVPIKSGMNNTRLAELISRLDSNAQGRAGLWQFKVEHITVVVVTDERADRMRVMARIAPAADLDEEELRRLMQANFDSALDARYAVAQDALWSAFVHPLASLGDQAFFSGVAQTVTLAHTFGSSYSSGALVFGGGDSNSIKERELFDRIIKRGSV